MKEERSFTSLVRERDSLRLTRVLVDRQLRCRNRRFLEEEEEFSSGEDR